MCHTEIYDEKSFYEKLIIVIRFLALNGKISKLWRMFSDKLVKTEVYVSRGTFQKENFFSYGTLSTSIPDFWGNLFHRVVKFDFYMCRGTFWENLFLYETDKFFNQNRTVRDIFLEI